MNERPAVVVEVGSLPNFAFGSHGVVWWGVLVFIAIEAMMMLLCMITYLYLRSHAAEWPPHGHPPRLLYATLATVVMLASVVPMIWLENAARHLDLLRVRIGLLVCLAIGIVFSVLRGLELLHLSPGWNANAYGSIIWTTIGLHTGHMVAEVLETAVIMVLMFRRGPIEGKYYSDVEDNALYWYFIVSVWVPVYAIIYLSPRWG